MKIEYEPCSSCASSKKPGWIFKDGTAKECRCHIKWRLKSSLAHRLEKNGFCVDEKLLSYTLSDLYDPQAEVGPKIEKYLTMFRTQGDAGKAFKHMMLYIYGPVGTQKTTLAQYIGKEVSRVLKPDNSLSDQSAEFYSAFFTGMNRLVKSLQDRDRNPEKVDSYFTMLERADVLIIDESFDKEKVTIYNSGYQLPFLDTFLREWWSNPAHSIIFVSNVPIDNIQSNGYSQSIQDFISRETRIRNGEIIMRHNFLAALETKALEDFDMTGVGVL